MDDPTANWVTLLAGNERRGGTSAAAGVAGLNSVVICSTMSRNFDVKPWTESRNVANSPSKCPLIDCDRSPGPTKAERAAIDDLIRPGFRTIINALCATAPPQTSWA